MKRPIPHSFGLREEVARLKGQVTKLEKDNLLHAAANVKLQNQYQALHKLVERMVDTSKPLILK